MRQELILTYLFVYILSFSFAQEALPLYEPTKVKASGDWLLYQANQPAALYSTQDGHLVLGNGLVSRSFSIAPNGATIGVDHLQTGESFLRSVRPEAEVQIDGIVFEVGGLVGQPIHNYLLPEWLESMEADPGSFKLQGYRMAETKERFPWKKREDWMPKDMPWPVPGKELVFSYKLDEAALEELGKRLNSDDGRERLVNDTFESLRNEWKRVESDADERSSFINEGKAGEIMALANTAVYAEQSVLPQASVFIARINPGTDKSSSWGPGIGLVFSDQVVKLNLRPGDEAIGFFDGYKELIVNGLSPGVSVWLRLELRDNKLLASWSYDNNVWTQAGEVAYTQSPVSVRVGKMDPTGKNSDHPTAKGQLERSRIEAFYMLGESDGDVSPLEAYRYLKDITVNVHYELYDGLPVFGKWITVENHSGKTITLNTFKSEILAVTEPESHVDPTEKWLYPNITVETDYNFGGMTAENIFRSSIAWKTDPLYLTQVNYERTTPVLLEVAPKYGPEQEILPGSTFASYRAWELIHDSWERERKGLEHRRMIRAMAPWVTENPILMHVRSAETEAVKKAIDQSAEVGFEMVIMTFGSGFNAEDDSEENINRIKSLVEYAHSKGVALGGYSLLASRRIGGGHDVVMPEGMTPRFGNSPCLESEWGHAYFRKLYNLYQKTGMDVFEHDGSYPGDVCAAEHHPGHRGLADSQWNQYSRIADFYQWSRSEGIYLNIPDYYFMAGSNKTAMGYRETNWSLPREQQEIIERQNIFDGTWTKTPSMGWMFVPLVEYHGGGKAATIEPLRDHLPHYGQRMANLFGAGVQATYRGPQLYDAPETKELVEHWVGFYKKHREVLDADIVHLRRPDGRDWDGILHVNPSGQEKGLLMLYNPLDQDIRRTIQVPVYYTGLHDRVLVEDQWGQTTSVEVSRDYYLPLEVSLPKKGYAYFSFK